MQRQLEDAFPTIDGYNGWGYSGRGNLTKAGPGAELQVLQGFTWCPSQLAEKVTDNTRCQRLELLSWVYTGTVTIMEFVAGYLGHYSLSHTSSSSSITVSKATLCQVKSSPRYHPQRNRFVLFSSRSGSPSKSDRSFQISENDRVLDQ